MTLTKPKKLNKGDQIATISPCWGVSGEDDVLWKYRIGKQRLENMDLEVVAAPNSMKGEKFLEENPQARAEDIIWAFESKSVKAIIANIGGNDSQRVLPYLNASVIKNNPKIFIGYSDVLNFHLFCYQAGLSTFYGHNLLPIISETPEFHEYSKHWFKKVLFDDTTIGMINPAKTFSCDENDYTDINYKKNYYKETGYLFIQGSQKVRGQLFGGHTGLRNFDQLTSNDFSGKILFIEDIANAFTPQHLEDFFIWLGNIGALQKLNGILIGRLCAYQSFKYHEALLLKIVNEIYDLKDLPIVANLNFGHTSPICILPYGAMAEIDCTKKTITITESGVI